MPATLLVVDLTRMLLDELEPALGYSKLRDGMPTNERKELIELLSRGMAAEDPQLSPEVQSPDPDDDHLMALASTSRSVLVSGD